jgi:hypothetical protein
MIEDLTPCGKDEHPTGDSQCKDEIGVKKIFRFIYQIFKGLPPESDLAWHPARYAFENSSLFLLVRLDKGAAYNALLIAGKTAHELAVAIDLVSDGAGSLEGSEIITKKE